MGLTSQDIQFIGTMADIGSNIAQNIQQARKFQQDRADREAAKQASADFEAQIKKLEAPRMQLEEELRLFDENVALGKPLGPDPRFPEDQQEDKVGGTPSKAPIKLNTGGAVRPESQADPNEGVDPQKHPMVRRAYLQAELEMRRGRELDQKLDLAMSTLVAGAGNPYIQETFTKTAQMFHDQNQMYDEKLLKEAERLEAQKERIDLANAAAADDERTRQLEEYKQGQMWERERMKQDAQNRRALLKATGGKGGGKANKGDPIGPNGLSFSQASIEADAILKNASAEEVKAAGGALRFRSKLFNNLYGVNGGDEPEAQEESAEGEAAEDGDWRPQIQTGAGEEVDHDVNDLLYRVSLLKGALATEGLDSNSKTRAKDGLEQFRKALEGIIEDEGLGELGINFDAIPASNAGDPEQSREIVKGITRNRAGRVLGKVGSAVGGAVKDAATAVNRTYPVVDSVVDAANWWTE